MSVSSQQDWLSVGRGVQLIYYMQKFFIGGDIGHRFAVMSKADIPAGIDDTIQRHSSQLEEIHFLSVRSGNRMVGVWQADEWDFFVFPILLKNPILIRSNSQDLSAAMGEPFIFLA